mgnify:CR=1 FL=1
MVEKNLIVDLFGDIDLNASTNLKDIRLLAAKNARLYVQSVPPPIRADH